MNRTDEFVTDDLQVSTTSEDSTAASATDILSPSRVSSERSATAVSLQSSQFHTARDNGIMMFTSFGHIATLYGWGAEKDSPAAFPAEEPPSPLVFDKPSSAAVTPKSSQCTSDGGGMSEKSNFPNTTGELVACERIRTKDTGIRRFIAAESLSSDLNTRFWVRLPHVGQGHSGQYKQ
jgi:hypothetical protein